MIKGWHDQDGQLHEKIYNVALSDNRRVVPQGGVPVVGNTVNLKDVPTDVSMITQERAYSSPIWYTP